MRELPAWFLVALSIACGDAADVSDATTGEVSVAGRACRDSSECGQSGHYFCRAPLATSAFEETCGVACRDNQDCASDANCPGEAPLCLSYLDDCCNIGDFASTLCAPACTADAACGEGRRCRSDGRGCETIPCDQGWACPVHTACRPAEASQPMCDAYEEDCGAGELEHGCIRQACQTDAECGGGVCVYGKCFEQLGTCTVTSI